MVFPDLDITKKCVLLISNLDNISLILIGSVLSEK